MVNREDVSFYLGIALIVLISFLLGILVSVQLGGELYEVQGKWTRNMYGFEGDWVHVNVNDISYERAVEVCKHEVGHEIFAEECEDNIDKCMEVVGR